MDSLNICKRISLLFIVCCCTLYYTAGYNRYYSYFFPYCVYFIDENEFKYCTYKLDYIYTYWVFFCCIQTNPTFILFGVFDFCKRMNEHTLVMN